jgi:hypothetical protein
VLPEQNKNLASISVLPINFLLLVHEIPETEIYIQARKKFPAWCAISGAGKSCQFAGGGGEGWEEL